MLPPTNPVTAVLAKMGWAIHLDLTSHIPRDAIDEIADTPSRQNHRMIRKSGMDLRWNISQSARSKYSCHVRGPKAEFAEAPVLGG